MAEIIDFGAEWLHRSIERSMDRGDWETASIESALLEGYLEGLWSLRFEGGEPVFQTAPGVSLHGPSEGATT